MADASKGKLLKFLKEQVASVEGLMRLNPYGPEFDIWEHSTLEAGTKLLGPMFPKLWQNNFTVTRFATDEEEHQQYYVEKMDGARRLILGMIAEKERLDGDYADEMTEEFKLERYSLHPQIVTVSKALFDDRHYADANLAAFREVIKRLKDYYKAKTGAEKDGDTLMNHAFGCEGRTPLIAFNGLSSTEEIDEQKGLMYLFKGIVGIRNRKAHEWVVLDNPLKAVEYLALASLLMRLLDEHAI